MSEFVKQFLHCSGSAFLGNIWSSELIDVCNMNPIHTELWINIYVNTNTDICKNSVIIEFCEWSYMSSDNFGLIVMFHVLYQSPHTYHNHLVCMVIYNQCLLSLINFFVYWIFLKRQNFSSSTSHCKRMKLSQL